MDTIALATLYKKVLRKGECQPRVQEIGLSPSFVDDPPPAQPLGERIAEKMTCPLVLAFGEFEPRPRCWPLELCSNFFDLCSKFRSSCEVNFKLCSEFLELCSQFPSSCVVNFDLGSNFRCMW